jgi:hypothetical protein
VVPFEVLPTEQAAMCFLQRLHRFAFFASKVGLALEPFLLRPVNTNGIGFKDTCMSSSSLNKRFQKLLSEVGLWEGETLHGVRRGSMQHDAAGGATIEQIGRRALHAPPFSTTALYLDTSRETGGAERLHNFKRLKTSQPSM